MKIFNLQRGITACIILIIASAWYPFSSCKQKDNPPDDGTIMFCRELKRADIKAWADKKWTAKDNPDFIRQLWFKVNKIDDRIQIDVSPMKNIDQPIAGGKLGLAKGSNCKQTLSDKADYSDNWVKMDSLHLIANDAGDLIDFSFIRLTPMQQYPPYVNYKIEVIEEKDGKENVLYRTISYPCPPHCPKPPADGDDDTLRNN